MKGALVSLPWKIFSDPCSPNQQIGRAPRRRGGKNQKGTMGQGMMGGMFVKYCILV